MWPLSHEIPTHSSVFPAGHVQSIPSLKSSPQQALDYEKSPVGASHMQQTHPFSTTSNASPFQVWEAWNLFHVHRGTACLRWENWGHSALPLYRWLEDTKSPELENMTMSIPLVHCNIKFLKKCLKLTFVYFTLRTGEEQIHIVSTHQILKAIFFCGLSSPVVW